jgi:tripartite-type tricarboxylate transporter receptor subunit TctC
MINLQRRRFLCAAVIAAAFTVVPQNAGAQDYPTRPVRILIGFPAGGTTDIVARLIGQWLSERLGQQFIIENRPGANTTLAVEAVARAPADGYTLCTVSTSNVLNSALYPQLTFDTDRDLAMIAGLNSSPLVLEVHPAVPVNSVPGLIAYAKANPGRISMASFGTGSISHVAGELFEAAAGIDMLHVPYRGSAPMLIDLLAGHVQAAFDNLPASIEHIRAGKLRALAVTTTTRSQTLPHVPSLSEIFPGYEAIAYLGLGAPKSTPAEIVNKLNQEINAGLADGKIRARLAELGGTPFVFSPAEFRNFIAAETGKWVKVIRDAKIRAEQ